MICKDDIYEDDSDTTPAKLTIYRGVNTCTVCGARSHKEMHPRCRMGYEAGKHVGRAEATNSLGKILRALWEHIWPW